MKKRTIVTLVLALILICAVMGTTGLMTFSGSMAARKIEENKRWAVSAPQVQSMKVIDLVGDPAKDVFVQGVDFVSVLSLDGKELFREAYREPLVTSMGMLDNQGESIVVFARDDSAVPTVSVFKRDTWLWKQQVPHLSNPARAAVIRFPEKPVVVVGDDSGRLAAFGPDGEPLWESEISRGDAVRALDDTLKDGKTFLVAANHNGAVAMFDVTGKVQWQYSMPGTIRRLRSFDLNGDGNSEILVGGDSSTLVMLNPQGGVTLQQSLGQAITEIREVEINGDPKSREFVVGGKKGGVWAFSAEGKELWSGSVSGKVTEIAGLDLNRAGAGDVLIGDDAGSMAVFEGKTGTRTLLNDQNGIVNRIDVYQQDKSEMVVVADANNVNLLQLSQVNAPFWYTPLLAGLLMSLVIAIAAGVIATLPGKPPVELKIENQSAEALQAQRRMLKESIADVDRLRGSGEMTPDSYLARLKELRTSLADNEAALLKLGISLKIETMKCPNCGGVLPLGLDKCDYCGQVVIQ